MKMMLGFGTTWFRLKISLHSRKSPVMSTDRMVVLFVLYFVGLWISYVTIPKAWEVLKGLIKTISSQRPCMQLWCRLFMLFSLCLLAPVVSIFEPSEGWEFARSTQILSGPPPVDGGCSIILYYLSCSSVKRLLLKRLNCCYVNIW